MSLYNSRAGIAAAVYNLLYFFGLCFVFAGTCMGVSFFVISHFVSLTSFFETILNAAPFQLAQHALDVSLDGVRNAVALVSPTLRDYMATSPRIDGIIALFSSSTLLWVLSVLLKDVSIVDSFWSLGFALLNYVYRQHAAAAGFPGTKERSDIMGMLVGVWAIRLSVYLAWRNHGQSEDFRYKQFRKKYAPHYWWFSLIHTFWLQSVLCFAVSQPLLSAQMGESLVSFGSFWDVFGFALWIGGFFFESVGDYQLSRFRSQNRNKEGKGLLTTGLWQFTRHPNYFGNATLFWGFFVLSSGVQNGWTSIYSPIFMQFLLMKVSGVPMMERSLSKRKEGFSEYVSDTSSFYPWCPARPNSVKSSSSSKHK